MQKTFFKPNPTLFYAMLFFFGGIGYCGLEILWRGHTHPSMMIAGGICFLLYYKLCEDEKNMPFFRKCLLGATLITCIELTFGTILNTWLSLNVWDYSLLPFNFYGQICILYFFLWFLLCIPLTWLCHFLQKRFFSASLPLTHEKSCKK